jgi:Rho-binding antiterminator
MSDQNDSYQPIACETYSQYELAIMHRQPLRIAWRDDDGHHRLCSVTPTDLQTKNHEEFLLATTPEGEALRIRLDRILSSNVAQAVG